MTMSYLATDQAESLRRLAGRAKGDSTPEALTVREGLRVISVTSGKGGVGNSSVVINLAASLAACGERVLIIDSNPGMGGDICLRLGKQAQYRLAQVAAGEIPMEATVVEVGGGISVLPAGMEMAQYTALSPRERVSLLQGMLRLQDRFDFFLIDTGAGIAANLTSFAAVAREIMLVVNPEPTSITDAYALMKSLSGRDSSFKFRLLVNMCRDPREGSTIFGKLAAITGRFLQVDMDLAGSIPHDALLVDSIRRRGAMFRLYPQAKASLGFKALAQKITGERPEGAIPLPVAPTAPSKLWRNHELSS